MLLEEKVTEAIIGGAIEVHKAIGPGLLESVYEECLCHELRIRNLAFQRQVEIPVVYKGVKLECGYKADIVVEESVVLELKSVEQLLPIHEGQLLIYMRLSNIRIGLLMNFNTPAMRRGIIRRVL